MSYKLSFVTKKTYANKEEKIIIKNGYMPNTEKIQRAKRLKKLKKQRELEELNKKFSGQLNFDSLEEERKAREEFERKYAPQLANAVRSMNRAKNELMDILKCNEFKFFVTLTFDKTKLDRLDDKQTRKAFTQWANDTRKLYPNMIYTATPEYHKKGGLHFHLLLGQVTAEELGLTDSGKRVKSGRTKGNIIYNISRWKKGFSTATEILDTEAVKYYLSKYLTKGKVDPRFFGKKRFYVSHNIKRPDTIKATFSVDDPILEDSICKELYNIDYEDPSKEYLVLSRKLEE